MTLRKTETEARLDQGLALNDHEVVVLE